MFLTSFSILNQFFIEPNFLISRLNNFYLHISHHHVTAHFRVAETYHLCLQFKFNHTLSTNSLLNE